MSRMGRRKFVALLGGAAVRHGRSRRARNRTASPVVGILRVNPKNITEIIR